MRIALLSKSGEQATNIRHYLLGRGHHVEQTDGKVTAEELAQFDIGISWFYRWILKQPELDAMPLGIVNCHPAMLPYCRGATGPQPTRWCVDALYVGQGG